MTTTRKWPYLSAAVVLGSLALSSPAAAQSAQVQQCVDASEQAQKLRDEHKLMMAREQLLVCARESCPAVVRKDCTDWLAGIESSLPSVVLKAHDGSGNDLSAVKVSLDDKPLFDHLDGKALLIDPGRHKFRFEAEGQPPVEQEVVISEGEKNRAVTAVFGSAAPSGGEVAVSSPTDVVNSSKKSFVLPVVFGTVGVLALGSWGFFGLTGLGDYNDLEASCGKNKNCKQTDVDSVHTKFVIADVSLAVGAVSLAIGGVLLAVQLSKKDAAEPERAAAVKPRRLVPRFDVQPLPGGGGFAGLHGVF